jgi:N-acetylglutamate synthase-like GNAT family acetyltransferase
MQHQDGTLPTTLIACTDDTLLGSVSLIHDDLPGWETLNPWLASLYVLPAQRRRGVGGTLLRAAEGLLVAAQIPTAYLFTEHRQAWFRARGWLHHAETIVAGHPATIMRREF